MRARNLFIALLFLMGIGFAAPSGAVDLGDLPVFGPLVQENPPVQVPVPDVDIDINKTDRVVWYVDPLFLIGAGVVVLIVVVALIARGGGGGTTIVRD